MRSAVILGIAAVAFAAAAAACTDNEMGTGTTLGSSPIVGNTSHFDACPAGGSDALPALRCAATAGAPRIALALCGDLVADNTLTLDSSGGNLVVSGTSTTSSPLTLSGDFESAGTIEARNTQQISGSLRGGADWNTSAPVVVDGDALLAGTLNATNTVSVTGKLQAASIDSNQTPSVNAGQVVDDSAPFTSELDCQNRPSVSALASSVVVDASVTAIFPADSLENVDAPTDISIACGPYVLTDVAVNSPLTIHVLDAATLIVRGNLTIAAPLVIDVAPGANFDLLIGGDVAVNNTLTISGGGAATTYVAIGGALTVASPFQLDGSLVVDGQLDANNTVDITGAAYLSGLHVAAPVAVHAGVAPAPAFSGNGCL
jgi:cytoskeletal protein CcmA (bactofilin family)